MDAKATTGAIRRSIYPFLKTVGGFTKAKGRNAWRFDEHTTSVANFRSFSPSLADGVGCTTFSFAINLGVFLRLGPFHSAGRPEDSLPHEADCPIRIRLTKSLRQPRFIPYASLGETAVTDVPDVFYVAADASNLEDVVHDARVALEKRGLPLFERFRDLAFTYRFLLHGDSALSSAELTHDAFRVERSGLSAPLCNAIACLGRILGVADPQLDLESSPAFPFLKQRARL